MLKMKKLDYPKISILFVTMNRRNKVIRFLKSVYSLNYPKNKMEIIMADNFSSDDTVSVVTKEFPKVNIIKNEYNYGIPIAFNELIKKSTGDYIFRSDDDVVFDKDCIKILVEFSLNNPNTVPASGLFYYNDRNRIRNFGGRLNHFTLKSYIMGKDEINNDQYKIREVEITAGGTLLIKRDIFNNVGEFDERLFLSHDDIDWQIRLNKKRYKIIVIPQAKLYHDHELNDKPSQFYAYHFIRSKSIMIRKYSPLFLPLFAAYVLSTGSSIKAMLSGSIFPKKIYYTKDFKVLNKY